MATTTRATQVHEALIDEIERFRLALDERAVYLDTAFGPYRVVNVTDDERRCSLLWATCIPHGGADTPYGRRSFALANDGTWADLLRQAGIHRDHLFAAKEA